MSDDRPQRHSHFAEDPAERGFGPGWTFYVPRQWDGAADYIIVHLYSDAPSQTADGWEGLWFQPRMTRATETHRATDREMVIQWAKAKPVPQLLVEDAASRTFSVVD